MSLSAHRKSRRLSQRDVAEAVGLAPRSNSLISDLERGRRHATLPLALKIEAWSEGQVPAASLLSPDDAALLAHHRRLAAAQPEGKAA